VNIPLASWVISPIGGTFLSQTSLSLQRQRPALVLENEAWTNDPQPQRRWFMVEQCSAVLVSGVLTFMVSLLPLVVETAAGMAEENRTVRLHNHLQYVTVERVVTEIVHSFPPKERWVTARN